MWAIPMELALFLPIVCSILHLPHTSRLDGQSLDQLVFYFTYILTHFDFKFIWNPEDFDLLDKNIQILTDFHLKNQNLDKCLA